MRKLSMRNLMPTSHREARDREAEERKALEGVEIDGRTMRRTGKTKQIIIRMTPEQKEKLAELAVALGTLRGSDRSASFTETIERAMLALEKELKGQ
jgi:hypothetical protein